MTKTLIFVPVSPSDAADAASGTLTDRRGFTVTPELLAMLGYDESLREDAEYAAMVIASVAGLADNGERIVLVAEVDPVNVVEGTDPTNGEVRVTELPASSIVAFFTDEPGVDVSAAAEAARGRSVDDAWDAPAVQALLGDCDLLWHGKEELAHLA